MHLSISDLILRFHYQNLLDKNNLKHKYESETNLSKKTKTSHISLKINGYIKTKKIYPLEV